MNDKEITEILTSTELARFGDSLINFAYSMALTDATGRPTGTKVRDRILADAAVRSGLRKLLPKRVDRGDVANSLEALMGRVWLEKMITLEEIVACLKKDSLDPVENFTELASHALSKLRKQ
ncbi:MAG TPA: ribonuclease III family protein [Candidatus Bathyarchaeia archaeon]|nr:ribonuclease III family protein [Candidatus Bathyarchaeia archaeon]